MTRGSNTRPKAHRIWISCPPSTQVTFGTGNAGTRGACPGLRCPVGASQRSEQLQYDRRDRGTIWYPAVATAAPAASKHLLRAQEKSSVSRIRTRSRKAQTDVQPAGLLENTDKNITKNKVVCSEPRSHTEKRQRTVCSYNLSVYRCSSSV